MLIEFGPQTFCILIRSRTKFLVSVGDFGLSEGKSDPLYAAFNFQIAAVSRPVSSALSGHVADIPVVSHRNEFYVIAGRQNNNRQQLLKRTPLLPAGFLSLRSLSEICDAHNFTQTGKQITSSKSYPN